MFLLVLGILLVGSQTCRWCSWLKTDQNPRVPFDHRWCSICNVSSQPVVSITSLKNSTTPGIRWTVGSFVCGISDLCRPRRPPHDNHKTDSVFNRYRLYISNYTECQWECVCESVSVAVSDDRLKETSNNPLSKHMTQWKLLISSPILALFSSPLLSVPLIGLGLCWH